MNDTSEARGNNVLRKSLLLVLLSFAQGFSVAAASAVKPLALSTDEVVIGASRVVFHENQGRAYVDVRNQSTKSRLLSAGLYALDADSLQAGERVSDFVCSPGVTILRADGTVPVRIVRAEKKLPEDRESAYLLRLRLIPEKDVESVEESGRVKTVFTTFLKVFYRPTALDKPQAVQSAAAKVLWRACAGGIEFRNPTPYWLTLAQAESDGKPLISEKARRPMLAPLGGTVRLEGAAPKHTLEIRVLTDQGFETDPIGLLTK